MRVIINGLLYDTETAIMIGASSHLSPGDHGHWDAGLYEAENGNYFLAGEGGPASPYGEQVDQNTFSGGHKIIPLTPEAAQKWAEENLPVEEVLSEFNIEEA